MACEIERWGHGEAAEKVTRHMASCQERYAADEWMAKELDGLIFDYGEKETCNKDSCSSGRKDLTQKSLRDFCRPRAKNTRSALEAPLAPQGAHSSLL